MTCAASAGAQTTTPDGSRSSPRPEIRLAVNQFKAQDPSASFSYFQGHVDSFAASAKLQIPDYALPVLKQLGLSTTARTPRTIGAPVVAIGPRPGRDLDADTTVALPYVNEVPSGTNFGEPMASDVEDPPSSVPPRVEARTQPAKDPHRMIPWGRPDAGTLALERLAATPILHAFLTRYKDAFAVTPEEAGASLKLTNYEVGAYFRKATYDQYYSRDEKLLYGRTLVHFDVNWNIIGISRMIITPAKYSLAASASTISSTHAVSIASSKYPDKQCAGHPATALRAERAVDVIRGLRVWNVEMTALGGECHWRTIMDAVSGNVLNVSDLIDRAYTDVQLNRWWFPGGDLYYPQQIISTGQYTRNDRRLEHDFFYIMNDHRCEGDPETNCSETDFACTWCSEPHGTKSGDSYIRATRKSTRNFTNYFPWGASEAFAETNAYYWSRQFVQWLKPSLDALGVLPGSASDYKRVLIITDACRSRSGHATAYSVTTDGNKGEGTNVIRLAHRNPAGPSTHNAACEAGGCFDNPSNIHHELNHFFLHRYYGVNPDLDCGSYNEMRFTHEGILGTAVPQAFWHSYYGVGYNPTSTNKLYGSEQARGRVHSSDSTNLTNASYPCAANTDDPYVAGRVAGQVLWEFCHGYKVTGSEMDLIGRPATDTDFNMLVYWAADLQSGSTYKDRHEFGNRLMEILDKHSDWPSSAKADYCEVFQHHGLRKFINSDYCN